MMDVTSTALAGLRTSAHGASVAAETIATGVAVSQRSAVSPVLDVESAIVDLLLSKIAYKANASVLRLAGQMSDTLLDVLA